MMLSPVHPFATGTGSFASTRSSAIATTIVAITGSSLALALFAPDLVSGSEHDHEPLAALTTWLWSACAIALVLAVVRVAASASAWRSFTAIVSALWVAAATAGVFAPELVTGSDPTRIPLVALLAPLLAAMSTAFACLYVATTDRT
jgi:hypothetical protein